MKIDASDWGALADDLDGQNRAVGANLYRAQDGTPDVALEARGLGKRFGVPSSIVESDMEVWRKRAQAEDRRRIVDESPGLRSFVGADPVNAAILDDTSVRKMGFFERKWRSALGELATTGEAVSGLGGFADAAQRRVLEGFANAFLPAPRAGGTIDPASLHGPTVGADFKAVGKPVADYWRGVDVPADQKDWIDQVAGGVVQMVQQVGLAALNPALSAGYLIGSASDQMERKTAGDSAPQAAKDFALLSGAPITAGTEYLVNRLMLGADKIPGLRTLDFKNALAARATRVGVAGTAEGAQETSESLLQDTIRQQLTNPNAEIGVGEALYEGSVGAAVGGIMRTMIEGALHVRTRQTRQMFDALHEAGQGNPLREKAPDAYREFVEHATKGGPVENVFIPADRFTTYFQAAGIDPETAATEIGVANYSEAVTTGSDIVIPLADFAAHVAGTDHYAGLAADLRLHQGDMTAREQAEYDANAEAREAKIRQSIDALIAEGVKAQGLSGAIDTITNDIEGQLIAAGVEPGTAKRQATAMRGVAVLAQRAFPGVDIVQAAEQLWQRYGLRVRRDLPAVLTQIKNANLDVDPLLDMLRGTGGPNDKQTFGQSLVPFLRERGGLAPIGELQDVEKYPTQPGQRKLVAEGGLTLDDAALAAQEAGYFADTDHTALVDAILAELEGQPAYSMAQTDEHAMGVQQSLAMLNQAVKDAGIDLNAVTDNAEVRRLLQQTGAVVGARFDQGGAAMTPTGVVMQRWQTAINSLSRNRMDDAPRFEAPTVMREVGIKARELTLPVRYLLEIRQKHPDVPLSVFENLPALLADPLLVIPYRNGGWRVFIDAATKAQSPIAVGVGADGRIQTITPIDPSQDTDSVGRIQSMIDAAEPRAKLYIRNKEASVKTEASTVAASGLIPLHRFSTGSRIVITRAQIVKHHGETFYQKVGAGDTPRDLVIQHNLSADNLLHALKMGGIPVPSLAVTKADHPLTGFGEITLLGSKEMADPKGYAGTKVFGADIYSPRYPSITLHFTDNMKKRGEAMLKAGMEATGMRYLDWSEVATRGAQEIENSPAVIWQLLTERGITPEIVRNEVKSLPSALAGYADDTRHVHELMADPDFVAAAYQSHEDMLVAVNGEDYREAARAEVVDLKNKAAEREHSYLLAGYARQIERYQRERRDAGSINAQATKYKMQEQVRSEELEETLREYALDFLQAINPDEKIRRGSDSQGRPRYISHTLENVVKILKQELRGGENFSYGVGNIRAMLTPQFKSIEQIRKAKGRLMDKAGFEKVKEEVDAEFFVLSNDLAGYHPVGGEFRFTESMTSMLYDAAKMGVPRALRENGFNEVPHEQQADIVGYLEKLRNLPTEYFEAKILREVDLAEFSGAVVPEGVNSKVLEALAKRGIKDVRTYKKGDEADRAAKIAEFEYLFFQKQGEAPRGYLQIGPDRKMLVGLTAKANLSTFLHETGHFYLEMMGDVAAMDGVSQQVKDDYAKILAFLGVSDRSQIETRHHEMFARANEAYLMEGRAPAPGLREVFQRFAGWLKSIYRHISKLDVELSDEVRGVFDRLYATDAEIDAAAAEMDIAPMPVDALKARMSPEEYRLYAEAVENATEAGRDALRVRMMREFQRGQAQWWKDEREQVRSEVAEEIDSLPVYRAFNALTTKDGEKLSRADLVWRYGEDFVKRLPRGFGRIYTREGGITLDAAAERFGFGDGAEMVKAIMEMRPRRELIEAETDQRMIERHGDVRLDGTATEQAFAAMNNDQRAEVLEIELRALGGRPAGQALKRAAEAAIGRTRHMHIRPHDYLIAGRKAARQAFDAALAGDMATAVAAKERELLNHYMHRAAQAAKDEAGKIEKHMRRMNSDSKLRARIGKAGQEWLAQVDDILVRFSFAPLSRTLKHRALAEWVEAEEEATGEAIAISPLVLNEAYRTNWSELTMDELRAIDDSLQSIEHVAKKIQRVMLNGQRYEMEQIVAQVVAAVDASPLKHREPPRAGEETSLADKIRAVDRTLWRPEKIMELLDNGTGGIFHDLLWNRATVAQTIAKDLKVKVLLPLKDFIADMPSAERARMDEAVYIQSLGYAPKRRELIGMALNMGNASNLDKLQRGGVVRRLGEDPIRISDAAVAEIKAALSPSDWQMITTLWQTIEQLYPLLNDLNMRAVGLPLAKVEAITVETPHGNFRGGYWPAVGDPLHSRVGETQEQTNAVSAADFFPQPFAQAATAHSFREARTGAAYPLLFDWQRIVSRHVAQATTDIAYHELIKESSRILRQKQVKAALVGKLGADGYQGLLDWLAFQVNATTGGMLGARAMDSMMQTTVAHTAVAALGFKVATALGNIVVAPAQASHQIKGRFMATGYAEFLRNPKAAIDKVRALSGEMRHRHEHLDATFSQVLETMAGKDSLRKTIARWSMEIHAVADVVATTGLWLGRYNQALAAGADVDAAVLAADKTIRTSQTAGAPKDLSAFERDPKYAWAKLFLGPMLIMQNEARGAFILRRDRMTTLIAVWLLPAVLFEMAVGRGPDDDEDELDWVIRKTLIYPLQTVPLVRDAASAVESLMSHKPAMTRANPVAEFALSGVNAWKKLASDTADEGDKAQAVLQTAGLITGLPGGAVGQATNYATDLATGETSMESPADLRYFFFRRAGDRRD